MALVVETTACFCFLVLHVAPMIYAQDDQSGFISLDCGSPKGSNYTQEGSGINYVSDNGFIDAGEIHVLSTQNPSRVYNTLRSFPENKRNCYTLRPQKGKNNRYLIRATFLHGNYDPRNQNPQFDLYIGADHWDTIDISDPSIPVAPEIIHLSSSDYINVCLVNTGYGYPFITSLELRLLDTTMYNDQSRSLILFLRYNYGTYDSVRYEDDKYDRIWYPVINDQAKKIQASDRVSVKPFSEEQIPIKIMTDGVVPIEPTWPLYWSWTARSNDASIIYVHLAEVEVLESNQKRDVNIYYNDIWIGTVSPSSNITTIRNHIYAGSSTYNLTLNTTLNSTLPPIINAVEIYTLKQLLQNQTDDQEAAAIWSTKSTYGLTKLNWQGDPCVPQAWVGLNCIYSDQGVARIISLNLSSRGLSGEIATALASLTMIESLDLSNNNLTGNVPKFLARLDKLRILNLRGNSLKRPFPAELLAKSTNGSLLLSAEESSVEDKSSCLEGSCRKNKQKIVVILAPIIGCIVVLSIIVFIAKLLKRKALLKRREVFKPRKQQFTYSEVVRMTNNFKNEIGRGGFGRVFHGFVGDSQVAVKMLSESSSQGYKEFQSEVKLLMEIHHTNITSLVGYCNDNNNNKAIIYDFMPNGNLEKHLFDGCPDVLSWERRLQIGCDAAEGLAYLHHGCRPPIVHRDVKSSNILLNEDLKAKLADFGLSRAFPTEGATHVSSLNVAGTVGYLDPEYHSTCRLTEKSDVYSFGVVLLELITSRRAISDGINIINWVKSLIEEGNVETIIDSRLEGRFDTNTAWKVIEIAIACASPTSVKRPTMNDVAVDLKHCVQAEKNRQSGPVSFNLEGVSDPNPR